MVSGERFALTDRSTLPEHFWVIFQWTLLRYVTRKRGLFLPLSPMSLVLSYFLVTLTQGGTVRPWSTPTPLKESDEDEADPGPS